MSYAGGPGDKQVRKESLQREVVKCETLRLGKWDGEGRDDRGQNDGDLNVKVKSTIAR